MPTASALMTTAGRVFWSSAPIVGSRLISQISPRRGLIVVGRLGVGDDVIGVQILPIAIGFIVGCKLRGLLSHDASALLERQGQKGPTLEQTKRRSCLGQIRQEL